MEKLAGVRANFLYTAYIVKKDSYNSKNRKFNVKKTRKARNKLRNEEKSEFHIVGWIAPCARRPPCVISDTRLTCPWLERPLQVVSQ